MDIPSYLLGKKAGGGSGGTSDYDALTNKPSINNVTLSGNKTTSDLGLFSGNYDDLTNKPTIPTVPTNVSAFTNDAGYLTQHQDLSNYITKSQTSGLVKNDGTIDTNTYLTQHQDISGKQDIMQYSTMPTASSETVGKIVQYTGTTDSTYTNGYFYIGKSDGQEPATYSWSNIKVQSVSISNVTRTVSNNAGSVIYLDNLEQNSLYLIRQDPNFFPAIRTTYIGSNSSYSNKYNLTTTASTYLYVRKLPKNVTATSELVATLAVFSDYYYDNGNSGYCDKYYKLYYNSNYHTITGYQDDTTHYISSPNLAETISAKKTFTVLPESSVTPTTDGQFTRKKYVDDKPTTYTGYDATKTQVLKNINGTLTWVDE